MLLHAFEGFAAEGDESPRFFRKVVIFAPYHGNVEHESFLDRDRNYPVSLLEDLGHEKTARYVLTDEAFYRHQLS